MKDISELVPRFIVDLNIEHKKLFIKYDNGIVLEVKGIKWTKRTNYYNLLNLGAKKAVTMYLDYLNHV